MDEPPRSSTGQDTGNEVSSSTDELIALAKLLLDDGYVKNETDARLAALHILSVTGSVAGGKDGRSAEADADEDDDST